MRINHNITALRALQQLNKNDKNLGKSLERLSSGLRINKASDDAAGLAITHKMDAQIRGLNQANRNAMDGISLIQTAEGALNEVHEMLQRMKELAVQAASGTYNDEDRKTIQDEVDQLREEIQRISVDIEFNEKKLLNGNIDRRAYSSNQAVLKVGDLSDEVQPGDYSLTIDTAAAKAEFTGGQSGYALANINSANAGTITINGVDVDILDGDTASDVFNKLRDAAEKAGASLTAYDSTLTTPGTFAFNSNMCLVFESNEYGSDQSLNISSSNATLFDSLFNNATYTNNPGTDVVVTLDTTSDFTTTATVSTKGNKVTIKDVNGFEMTLEDVNGAATSTATVTVLDVGPLSVQIGANKDQNMEVRVQDMSPKSLGIDAISLLTSSDASDAIEKVGQAISIVSSVRSKLGAYQNRLEHTVANLDVASENLTASYSRIMDADMAEEMAIYTQRNILTQASTSMLAQANQRPQTVLQLLQR